VHDGVDAYFKIGREPHETRCNDDGADDFDAISTD
jgi:hypothetical protein